MRVTNWGGAILSPAQKAEIEKLETSFTQHDATTAGSADGQRPGRSALIRCLRSHGQNDLWQLAADLARKNVEPEVLEALFATLRTDTARAALVRIAASVEIAELLNEIESSTARISDLVRAIKEYTYMDQAPVQNVDIVKSLETTLTILNHKLKHGVTVVRDYQTRSAAGEFVWQRTESGLDQHHRQRHRRDEGQRRACELRTYREDGCVVVEIGDNGPGIPAEIQPRIFEPFFTTKGVGEGTGLGLDTVQRIVKKHRGSIQVKSKPGDTCFQIWLPLSESAV